MPGVKGRCGGRREGAGRKPEKGGAAVFVGARVPPDVREWLALWGETDTKALNFALERAMKFWPKGPGEFGHVPKKKGIT